MKTRSKDAVSLAFSAPLVMSIRAAQMMSGTMSSAEFSRMWIEKPMALAQATLALQTAMATNTMAAFGLPLRRNGTSQLVSAGLGPFTKAIETNRRRLTR